jgi:2,4-dienoyl-CoA reductase (NADPH2)
MVVEIRRVIATEAKRPFALGYRISPEEHGAGGLRITVSFILLERIGGRVPLMAAGHIRTPEQALQARALGLPMIAVGQGLVMNPDWVTAAQADRNETITTTLDLSRTTDLAIPAKLTKVIANTPGWFVIAEKRTLSMASL